MINLLRKTAFTLIEIMVALVIVSTIAALAMPKFLSVVETTRAKEGEQFLYALLAAQKRYAIDHDNGDATPDYADLLNDLDVTVNVNLQNFNTPTDADINTVNPVAKITRTGGTYTLTISDTGIITCNCGGSQCATCIKMGYPSP